MRIADGEGKPLSSVYLALSDDEANELIDALRDLLKAQGSWHAHVSNADYQREITVYREDDDSASF
jgi:hypothetical protein